jgi:hypothetical protein
VSLINVSNMSSQLKTGILFLLQLPKYMWVDNSRTVAAQLYDTIPSLSRVLEDATHVMRRVFETIPDAHSLKGEKSVTAFAVLCYKCLGRSSFKSSWLKIQMCFLSWSMLLSSL